MIIDGRWVFVGSMNIDPRSANLNTEMGVLVESPELAAQLRDQFDHIIGPEMSYRVVLEEGEGLVWYDRVQGKDRRLEREPDASAGRRLTVTLLRLVPSSRSSDGPRACRSLSACSYDPRADWRPTHPARSTARGPGMSSPNPTAPAATPPATRRRGEASVRISGAACWVRCS